jgi:hypothetical protein
VATPLSSVCGTSGDGANEAQPVRIDEPFAVQTCTIELKLYPGVNHKDVAAAFSDFLHARASTREDVLAWIDVH